jgi:hypothetical protein
VNNFGVWDAGERTAWTVAETALALALSRAGDWPPWITVALAGVLAAVKTATALRYGNGTAAFLPRRVEPRPPDTPPAA